MLLLLYRYEILYVACQILLFCNALNGLQMLLNVL